MPTEPLAQRILVIANRTCPCPELRELLLERAGDTTRIAIVAPALNGRLAHAVSDTDGAVRDARERLDTAVDGLQHAGLTDVQAVVGDSDPFVAIGDTLVDFPADEIIVSSWPRGDSNWLEKHLVDRTREGFDGTVHHIVSEYGLERSSAPVG